MGDSDELGTLMIPSKVFESAVAIWNYHQMGHQLSVCDLIFVLGSHDLRVAERAAELYQQGLAPRVLMSGGFGNFTKGHFSKPEAELFAEVARENGVPDDCLLIEGRSTNTGENVQFSRELLEASGIAVSSVIAVQKPYMERRTFATIRKQWPGVSVCVTSPRISFENYLQGALTFDIVTNIMVGDLARIIEYPRLGFQIHQDVPSDILTAYQFLVSQGYDQHTC